MTCKFFTDKLIDDQNELFISHPSPFERCELPLNPESFKILHLNGVAMASNICPENKRIMDILSMAFTYNNYPVNILTELYHYLKFESGSLGNSLENHMLFGWENLDEYLSPKSNFYIFNEARKVCEATEVLIIIGYSFPIFNQNVDSFLFSNLKNLHTIFIQSNDFDNVSSIIENNFIPNLNSENKFKVKIKNVGYTNQFSIPRNNIEGEIQGYYSLF